LEFSDPNEIKKNNQVISFLENFEKNSQKSFPKFFEKINLKKSCFSSITCHICKKLSFYAFKISFEQIRKKKSTEKKVSLQFKRAYNFGKFLLFGSQKFKIKKKKSPRF